MSAGNPTYSLSINPSVIDKPDQAGRGRSSKNWQRIEATRGELCDQILRGYAIAPQFKNGRRKAVDFERAGFLAADVDDGMTLEDTKDNAFVRQHASLIHTTASHTPEKNRYRIFFLLDNAIHDPQDWADAQLGLAIVLGSDRSVSDAARMFFGNSSAAFFPLCGSMPTHVVADLIERGRAARAQIREADGRLLPVDSARRIAGAELVKLATGETVRMDEIGPNVSVHCPNHDDADPSAFTVPSNRNGTIGIARRPSGLPTRATGTTSMLSIACSRKGDWASSSRIPIRPASTDFFHRTRHSKSSSRRFFQGCITSPALRW